MSLESQDITKDISINCIPEECAGQCCENLCIPETKNSKISCKNNSIVIDTEKGEMDVCKYFCSKSLFPEGTFGRVNVGDLSRIVDISSDTVSCACYNPFLEREKSLVKTFNVETGVPIEDKMTFGMSVDEIKRDGSMTWIIILVIIVFILMAIN